jgi:kinesin family protein 18/19
MLGYNSTALAYGVTGTGKTHTMFGDIYLNLNFEKGICMFAVEYLFDKIRNEKDKIHRIKINYLEIYNEQVIDLLVDKSSSSNTEQNLMIVEDPSKGTIVPDLTEYAVTSSDQVLNLIILGNSRRTMAPTGVNQFSSRSHAILQINVEQTLRNKDEFISSKLLLVDLAGSERGSLEKGIRREEGANINKSLLALGNCINILSDKTKKGSFVPYRDSKLTRLLKDSLGGNISTIMIACISPSVLSYDETINTLKYASRARRIQKKVTKNVKEIDHFNSQYKEMIENLKSEINQLKDIITNQNILLRNRPIDSFREEKEFIKLNLNLNLNINNGSNQIASLNNHNPYRNEDFTYEFRHSKNTSGDLGNYGTYPIPFKKEFNFEVYEDFLNKNLNNFNDDDFDNFEKKLEG